MIKPTGEGFLLVQSNSCNVCHTVQRGIEAHYGVLSNVVKRGSKWQVLVVIKMSKLTYERAYAYALGVIDTCAEFRLDTDRL